MRSLPIRGAVGNSPPPTTIEIQHLDAERLPQTGLNRAPRLPGLMASCKSCSLNNPFFHLINYGLCLTWVPLSVAVHATIALSSRAQFRSTLTEIPHPAARVFHNNQASNDEDPDLSLHDSNKWMVRLLADYSVPAAVTLVTWLCKSTILLNEVDLKYNNTEQRNVVVTHAGLWSLFLFGTFSPSFINLVTKISPLMDRWQMVMGRYLFSKPESNQMGEDPRVDRLKDLDRQLIHAEAVNGILFALSCIGCAIVKWNSWSNFKGMLDQRRLELPHLSDEEFQVAVTQGINYLLWSESAVISRAYIEGLTGGYRTFFDWSSRMFNAEWGQEQHALIGPASGWDYNNWIGILCLYLIVHYKLLADNYQKMKKQATELAAQPVDPPQHNA